MHARNESWILVLNNYFNLPSSKYANFKVILSLNGLQIKKSIIKNHIYLVHKMRYATDETWEYKVGNLENRRIDGGIEENLVITGDEEEERPVMKQENTELEVARAWGGRRAI